MGFLKLKPPTRTSKIKPGESIVSELFRQALNGKARSFNGRAPALRPSSFPICPILNWRRKVRAAKEGFFEEEETAMMQYYTRVGTVTHTTFQYWIGFSGKIFGNWKCINRECKLGRKAQDIFDASGQLVKQGKTTAYHTTDNVCSACNKPMFYEELEVTYRGVKGHIDGVVEIAKNRYWVFDYKTSSKEKVNNKNALPEKKHIKQLRAYAFILKKKYKMNIEGFSLIYLARDNPRTFCEKSFKWDKKVELEAKKSVLAEIQRFNASEDDFKNGVIDKIIEHKPCKCEADYYEQMDFFQMCPVFDYCFNKRVLKSKLLEWQTKYSIDIRSL